VQKVRSAPRTCALPPGCLDAASHVMQPQQGRSWGAVARAREGVEDSKCFAVICDKGAEGARKLVSGGRVQHGLLRSEAAPGYRLACFGISSCACPAAHCVAGLRQQRSLASEVQTMCISVQRCTCVGRLSSGRFKQSRKLGQLPLRSSLSWCVSSCFSLSEHNIRARTTERRQTPQFAAADLWVTAPRVLYVFARQRCPTLLRRAGPHGARLRARAARGARAGAPGAGGPRGAAGGRVRLARAGGRGRALPAPGARRQLPARAPGRRAQGAPPPLGDATVCALACRARRRPPVRAPGGGTPGAHVFKARNTLSVTASMAELPGRRRCPPELGGALSVCEATSTKYCVQGALHGDLGCRY
jgi:hypothetical protein